MEGKLSPKADVYSFGVLMWQLYTCLRPWGGSNHAQIIHNVVVKKLRLQFPHHAPEEFVELANRCMDPDPETRPTMGDVLEVGRDGAV